MGIRKFKIWKVERVDNILKETKFSSRTKALMTYYNSGITPAIAEFVDAIQKANIPQKYVKTLALHLYDAARNGRPNIAGHSDLSAKNWQDKIFTNPKFVMMTYNRMSIHTLDRWKEAIKLIDSSK